MKYVINKGNYYPIVFKTLDKNTTQIILNSRRNNTDSAYISDYDAEIISAILSNSVSITKDVVYYLGGSIYFVNGFFYHNNYLVGGIYTNKLTGEYIIYGFTFENSCAVSYLSDNSEIKKAAKNNKVRFFRVHRAYKILEFFSKEEVLTGIYSSEINLFLANFKNKEIEENTENILEEVI